MRLNSVQLIKFCGTRTNPAADTKSIGLLADARVSWFLQIYQDSFIVTRQLSPVYRDLVHSRQITVTRYLLSPIRTCKNHATATQTAPNQTAGLLAFMWRLSRPEIGCHFFKEPKEE
jgi:hypothetical protein